MCCFNEDMANDVSCIIFRHLFFSLTFLLMRITFTQQIKLDLLNIRMCDITPGSSDIYYWKFLFFILLTIVFSLRSYLFDFETVYASDFTIISCSTSLINIFNFFVDLWTRPAIRLVLDILIFFQYKRILFLKQFI